MHYYYIKNYPYGGKVLVSGTINAETPKKALERYLLHFYLDNQTIQFCKRAARKDGADFCVEDCTTHRKSYFIVM